MQEFYIASNGGGQLRCGLWTPEGEAKAVVQIIHGIAEHIGRYDDFASFLAARGYVVAADDHMGHGGSVTDGLYGYFRGGWMSAVADEKTLHDKMAADYPGLPYYILGHSMGSFLLRTYLYTYPDALDAAVISGTGWEPMAKVKAGQLVCKLEEKRVGETNTSKLVTNLMFGSYNKPFAPVRTKNDWICSVDEVVDAYTADPWCGFDATVGLARDLLSGVERNEKPENLAKMNKQLPVLFVSGGKDPVGGMSRGVLTCIECLQAQRHEERNHPHLPGRPPRDAQREQSRGRLRGHPPLARGAVKKHIKTAPHAGSRFVLLQTGLSCPSGSFPGRPVGRAWRAGRAARHIRGA